MDAVTFDRYTRILLDVKNVVHYHKSEGNWYWSDKDEAEQVDLWKGPFPTYFAALLDAIEPYLSAEREAELSETIACNNLILPADRECTRVTVNNVSVHIKRQDEGVSVYLYPLNTEDRDCCLGETYCTFAEAGADNDT